MGLVGDFRQHQQIVAAEALGAPPAFLLIAVDPLERDVETRPAFRFVLPDGGFDAADPNFLDGLVSGFLLRHDSSSYLKKGLVGPFAFALTDKRTLEELRRRDAVERRKRRAKGQSDSE